MSYDFRLSKEGASAGPSSNIDEMQERNAVMVIRCWTSNKDLDPRPKVFFGDQKGAG